MTQLLITAFPSGVFALGSFLTLGFTCAYIVRKLKESIDDYNTVLLCLVSVVCTFLYMILSWFFFLSYYDKI